MCLWTCSLSPRLCVCFNSTNFHRIRISAGNQMGKCWPLVTRMGKSVVTPSQHRQKTHLRRSRHTSWTAEMERLCCVTAVEKNQSPLTGFPRQKSATEWANQIDTSYAHQLLLIPSGLLAVVARNFTACVSVCLIDLSSATYRSIGVFAAPSLKQLCSIEQHHKIINTLRWHHAHGTSPDLHALLASGSSNAIVYVHNLHSVIGKRHMRWGGGQ